jgi:MFS transporter, ACS family, allantoate permease
MTCGNDRYMYILLGCLTLLLSLAVFIVIPDQPFTCWWLSKRERQIVVHRTAVSQVAIKSQEFKKYQMVEALTDFKAWL